MRISFEPVALDIGHGDGKAVLVFRDGRLMAVASELGAIHGGEEGRWYVETLFGTHGQQPRTSFADLEELRAWALETGRREQLHALIPRIKAR